MLTQRFLALVRELLSDLENCSAAQKTLAEIGDHYAAIAAEHDKLIAVEAPALLNQRNAAITKLNEAARTIALTDFNVFYRDLHGIEQAVDRFLAFIHLTPFRTLDLIKSGLEEFRNCLQVFLARKQIPQDALRVVVAAETLAELLAGVRESFEVVERELECHPPADVDTLTVEYDATLDLSELLKLLAALLSIWQRVCREFEIDPTDRPLTVARLETGSTFVELLSHPFVAGIVMHLITKSEAFNKFLSPTEASSKELDNALKMAKLVDWLKEQGKPTEHLQVKIAKIETDESPNLRRATEGLVNVRRNKEEVVAVKAMRLLDARGSAQKLIENKAGEPPLIQ